MKDERGYDERIYSKVIDEDNSTLLVGTQARISLIKEQSLVPGSPEELIEAQQRDSEAKAQLALEDEQQ